jgi:hypothetical protein
MCKEINAIKLSLGQKWKQIPPFLWYSKYVIYSFRVLFVVGKHSASVFVSSIDNKT